MRKWVMFCLSILLISFISASFSVGNKSSDLVTAYGPNMNVSGWVNISFTNQDGNTLLRDSRDNSIQLISLLKNQTDYSFSCVPSGCDQAYSESNGETEKSFNLNVGGEKLMGIKITGGIKSVSFSGFQLESNAVSDCSNQIRLDFLNDGSYEKGNTNSISDSCAPSRSYGCFNSSKTSAERNLGEIPYCQKITLTESPGFKLGAWVKKVGANSTIRMSIKNLDGELIEGTSCNLQNALTEGSEIFCETNFSVTESQEYYVCIESTAPTSYKIKGYEDINGCGFYGESLGENIASYNIFAEGKKFGPVGTINITNNLQNENTLTAEIQDYLTSNYPYREGSCSDCIADCSSGCIIPIKIKSGKSQSIILKELKLNYITSAGDNPEDKFYDLEESAVKVISGYGKLKIDNVGLSVPPNYGNYTFDLFLGGNKILTQNLIVERIPEIFGLKPTLTVSALPTEFEVNANSSNSIDKYYWKFGDGQDKITSSPKVIHTYNSTGTYTLEIQITDSMGKISSRKFNVIVGDPKQTIRRILDEKKQNLNTIKSQITDLGGFYTTELNKILEIVVLENKLKDIERRYASSFSEGDFNKLMTELFPLEIPSSIEISKEGRNISFYSKTDLINLDIIGEIEKSNYDSTKSQAYREAILGWGQENLETSISFKEISGVYNSEVIPIGTFFSMAINKKIDPKYSVYFILKDLSELSFKENYLENKKSGYEYIELKQQTKTIEFFTTENILFSELPAFISPGLDRLSIIEINLTDEPLKIKWTLLILVLLLVFMIGIVVYIILQEWYRKRYESYLFRDQTNLYNLIYYIDSSKIKSLSESEIEKKLRASGWNGEQITYALNKYAGKRTGMLEIPINKLLERLRKKNENILETQGIERPISSLPPRSVLPMGTRPNRPFPRIIPVKNINSKNLENNRKMFFKK